MTDTAGPDEPSAHETPLDPARPTAEPQSAPPLSAPPPSGPAAAAPGKMRPVIIIGVIVAFLAIVLFAVRNNVEADDLKVGDCFNIPNGSTIKTVEKHPCTESHNAEVIHVGQYTDGSTYPISLSLDRYIETSCVPAFESYVGRAIDSEPALTVGYFHPTRDAWESGSRTITCYVAKPDESPMTQSVKS
ncbi:MAG: septum formation family protein [Chloroflexi bacterium]|nr:septum formation family protein [Chloroflexota bacterium]